MTWAALIQSITMTILSGYVCFCSYSFYARLKEDESRTQHRRSQYQSPFSMKYQV